MSLQYNYIEYGCDLLNAQVATDILDYQIWVIFRHPINESNRLVECRDSFSMSDLTDSDMKNVINVLEADIPDSINVSNQSFIF